MTSKNQKIGKYTDKEVKNLEVGMDFRLPKYRREVFLRFYEFHLKYDAHPGAVYYVLPYLKKTLLLDDEQMLWLTFLNGCSQNIITSYLLFVKFPNIKELDIKQFSKYFRDNYKKFGWDTDRRYHKNSLEQCIESYIENLNGKTQVEFYKDLTNTDDVYQNFRNVWDVVRNNFYSFGRLSTFSYLEYLRIIGIPLDCDNLYFEDIAGSKSHRNGMCKVLGRDDLEWFKQPNPYNKEIISWISKEADSLFAEAKERINHKHVSLFTFESTLCCYKSWHRPNRRYPNVYNDMFYDRIIYATKMWQDKDMFSIFWKCRRHSLPKHLLLECNPKDVGVNKIKQNHYRLTGEVIMMDKEYQCFKNKYNEAH